METGLPFTGRYSVAITLQQTSKEKLFASHHYNATGITAYFKLAVLWRRHLSVARSNPSSLPIAFALKSCPGMLTSKRSWLKQSAANFRVFPLAQVIALLPGRACCLRHQTRHAAVHRYCRTRLGKLRPTPPQVGARTQSSYRRTSPRLNVRQSLQGRLHRLKEPPHTSAHAPGH